jgi:hypothetical protein
VNAKNRNIPVFMGLVMLMVCVFPAAAQDKLADNKWEFYVIPYLRRRI